jgi:molecular chaperone GrpE
MRPLDAREKERLVEEFRACLEQWEEEGKEESEPVDLRTLLGEMAALKNEVRLESRQFKSALEELKSSGEALRAHNERLARDLERAREQAAEAQRQAERRLLLGMLDLRDRLQAGADAAAARRPSVLARLVPGETRFAGALGQGLTLTLQRLDELLSTHRVRPIDALGQPLDPQRMRAVGVESAPEAPDGVVLHEARRGFFHSGELLRAAEVIVNKKATHP